MIHTLELSKMLSKQTYDDILASLSIRNYRRCWLTMDYADKGFTVIRLYKFKRKEAKTQDKTETDFTHRYMISICINTGVMFGGDAHFSNNILSFTTDFVRTIYRNIYDLIPCMELEKEYFNTDNSHWLEYNAFKARRIDFCFDLKTMHHEYLNLIDKGYSLRKSTFTRNYYEDTDIQEIQTDDEPNIPELETVVDSLSTDVNYVYFKSKGVNINIYLKENELTKKQLPFNPELDYDFLRLEVATKKTKLNTIVSKFGLKGRELQYLITPEVEQYVLNSYVKALTGTGIYVTLDNARNIINKSKYTKPKKQRLIKIIETVSAKHGIAKVLEQVDNRTITDLGSLKTVKNYLREIQQELHINPVTIPTTMNVQKQIWTNLTCGMDVSEPFLPSLVDVLNAYNQQIKEEQQQGISLTQEMLEQIDKIE